MVIWLGHWVYFDSNFTHQLTQEKSLLNLELVTNLLTRYRYSMYYIQHVVHTCCIWAHVCTHTHTHTHVHTHVHTCIHTHVHKHVHTHTRTHTLTHTHTHREREREIHTPCEAITTAFHFSHRLHEISMFPCIQMFTAE